jgi:hypothetical protein
VSVLIGSTRELTCLLVAPIMTIYEPYGCYRSLGSTSVSCSLLYTDPTNAATPLDAFTHTICTLAAYHRLSSRFDLYRHPPTIYYLPMESCSHTCNIYTKATEHLHFASFELLYNYFATTNFICRNSTHRWLHQHHQHPQDFFFILYFLYRRAHHSVLFLLGGRIGRESWRIALYRTTTTLQMGKMGGAKGRTAGLHTHFFTRTKRVS